MGFDTRNFRPMRDATFRGKPLSDLTHEETLAALCAALEEVYLLQCVAGRPPQRGVHLHEPGPWSEPVVINRDH